MIETQQRPDACPTILLHPSDNVLIARTLIELGAKLDGGLSSRGQVPSGHKIASRPIAKGDPIRKYNVTIGFASVDIPAGAYVHSHNIEFREYLRDYAYTRDYKPVVNCSATVVHAVADWFRGDRLADYPNVDGVVAFAHALGCGMEMTGEPMDLLRRTMAGYALHANLAGALVVGLGCERNQVSKLFDAQGLATGSRLQTFVMQDEGGTTKTIAAGVAAVKAMLPEANKVTRTPIPASHITVGLQCGGSDGFSSITANPALGAAMDLLVRHGGTAILSETPEIYGVEHTLTARARSKEVGEKLIERIRWWKDEYTPGRDTQINGVVSPGNQSGGLANIFEKSLGSSMKGGTGPLMEVYRYAEPVKQKGLVFMDTPGFDPVSATGQIAGGANIIAFTTGRGSMFGAKPVPSIKLATNTPMYTRLTEDMDINCGGILDGTHTLQEMGQEIFELVLRTCSGDRSKSELLGLGDHEFVPWNIGVTG